MIGISLDASGDNHDVSIDTTEAANECPGAGAGPQRPQAVSLVCPLLTLTLQTCQYTLPLCGDKTSQS